MLDTTYYGFDTFGKDHSIHVFKIENRVVFTTNKRIYTYDDLNDTIVPYESLNTAIGKYQTSHRIIEAPNHYYWFIRNDYIGLLYIFQDEIRLIKEYPASLFEKYPLVDKYENILPLTEKTAILCLQNGIAYLNAEVNDLKNTLNNYRPIVRQIELSTDRGKKESLPLISNHIKIKNNFHNIYFRFSFPRINETQVSYQYKLEG